jgi:DNA processing protein
MNQIYYIPVFHNFTGVASGTLRKLYQDTPDFAYWWNASREDFQRVITRNPLGIYEQLEKARQTIDFQKVQDYFKTEEIQIIPEFHSEYPESLKNIDQPPFVLYWRGSTSFQKIRVAIIGTRKFSSYGEKVCRYISGDLAKDDVTIISGLALGIDGIAHDETLKRNGHAVAVLGGGVDDASIYPTTNRKLADRILGSEGAIISEYPPGTRPRAEYFPARNRIVSGLSQAVIVVEAAKKSGTMITAEIAQKQGKELFAVPGQIFEKNTQGTHELLKNGAQMLTSAQDILEVLGAKQIDKGEEEVSKEIFQGSEEEYKVYETLQSHSQGLSLNQLAEKTGVSMPDLMTTLTMLEMSGYISQTQIGNYIALGNYIMQK